MEALIRPHTEKDRPPLAILRLDEIRVARRRDREGTRTVEVSLREDWIAVVWHEGSARRLAPEHHLGMLVRRPAFGANQIVLAVHLQHMRCLDPDRMLREVDAAVHDHRPRTDELLRREIELLNPD